MVILSKQRIEWVDWLKAICIFLVVWTHYNIPIVLKQYIVTVHVPIFFFLAGFLNRNTSLDLKSYIKRFVRSIIIPYFSIGLFVWIIWAFKENIHPGKNIEIIPTWFPLVGMLYGTSVDIRFMRHSPALWFFPVLFCMHSLHYVSRKFSRGNLSYIVLVIFYFLLSHLLWKYLPFRLPWGLETAMSCMIFYGFGNIFRSIYDKNIIIDELPTIKIFILLMIIHMLAVYFGINGIIDYRIGAFYNSYALIVAGLASILCYVSAFWKIKLNKFVALIGRNTLSVFGFLTIFSYTWSSIRYFIFHISNDDFLSTFEGGILYTFICVIVLSIFGEGLRKIAPWMIGEIKR